MFFLKIPHTYIDYGKMQYSPYILNGWLYSHKTLVPEVFWGPQYNMMGCSPQKCLLFPRYCILPLLTVLPIKSECKVASSKESPYNSILKYWMKLNKDLLKKMHPYCIYTLFTIYSIQTHKLSMLHWNDIRVCVYAYSWGPNPTGLGERFRNAPIAVYNCTNTVSYSITSV